MTIIKTGFEHLGFTKKSNSLQYVVPNVTINGTVLKKLAILKCAEESPVTKEARELAVRKVAKATFSGNWGDITDVERKLAAAGEGSMAWSLYVPGNDLYSGKIWINERDDVLVKEGIFGMYNLKDGKTDFKNPIWVMKVVVKEEIWDDGVMFPVLEFSSKDAAVDLNSMFS